MKRTAFLLAAGLALSAPAVVHATPITTDSNFTVTWSLLEGSAIAKASATFSDFVFSGDTVTFDMGVANTSEFTLGNDVRLTALGWDTTPATTAATDNSSVLASIITNTKLAGDSVSVCLSSGNCNGGGNGGLEDPLNAGLHGDPDATSFVVTMTFADAVPSLDFSNFDAKFQTASGSIEGPGTVTPNTPVPEPASLALLGMGLAGLAMVIRRPSRAR